MHFTGAEVSRDRLTIRTIGGDDNVDASDLAAGVFGLTLDGGGGDDMIVGSAGNDQVIGGDGDDVAFMGDGESMLVSEVWTSAMAATRVKTAGVDRLEDSRHCVC